MSTLKELSNKIAKSSRFKHAIFSEDANETDLLAIHVDLGLAIFEATKKACVRAYGSHRFTNSTDIKKFIADVEFPSDVQFAIR